jgi:hypothetical protein
VKVYLLWSAAGYVNSLEGVFSDPKKAERAAKILNECGGSSAWVVEQEVNKFDWAAACEARRLEKKWQEMGKAFKEEREKERKKSGKQ